MGMPLSRFTQLAEVVNNPENKSQLAGFKVYCILLQGKRDYGFNEVLRMRMNALDRYTAQDLLFISFCNRDVLRENYVTTDFAKRALENMECESVADEEAAVGYFRSLLNVKDRDGSVIVVSTDLKSPDVAVLGSNAGSVVIQLEHIADYARGCHRGIDINDNSFVEFLNTLGRCSFGSFDQSLAATLYEVVAASAVSDFHEDYYSSRDDVKAVVRSTVDKYYSRIPKCTDYNVDEWDATTQRYFAYRQLCKKRKKEIPPVLKHSAPLSFGLMHISKPRYIVAKSKPGDRYKIDSRRLYGLMNKANQSRVTQYNGLIALIYGVSDEDLEDLGDMARNFELASVSLCNIFTAEANESFVQLMRKAMGIAMPDFYLKYMPDLKCFVPTGLKNEVVNLNRRDDNGWRAPEIGKALYALQHMLEDKKTSAVLKAYPFLSNSDFMDAALVVCNVRNAGGHAEPVIEREFDKQFEAFSFLYHMFLPDMLDLKVELRSAPAL